MLDFNAFRNGETTLAEMSTPLTHQNLIDLTNEMLDLQRAVIADATDADAIFVPIDPEATEVNPDDDTKLGWTIAHVICHATASGEEGAARSLSLARGVVLEGRSRYETPWESITTSADCLHRLDESRRMRLAMLAAWPDVPHLDTTMVIVPRFGPLNAIAAYLLGLAHDQTHYGQLRKTMDQAFAVRSQEG